MCYTSTILLKNVNSVGRAQESPPYFLFMIYNLSFNSLKILVESYREPLIENVDPQMGNRDLINILNINF